jgi:hypothetical protein
MRVRALNDSVFITYPPRLVDFGFTFPGPGPSAHQCAGATSSLSKPVLTNFWIFGGCVRSASLTARGAFGRFGAACDFMLEFLILPGA